jgi:hypothetical protein
MLSFIISLSSSSVLKIFIPRPRLNSLGLIIHKYWLHSYLNTGSSKGMFNLLIRFRSKDIFGGYLDPFHKYRLSSTRSLSIFKTRYGSG